MFQEVFVNNDRLQGVLEERWNGPEARRVMALTNQRLEPTISNIGAALFGTPDGAITEEFARVVRHRILHKDSRWFTLKLANPEEPRSSQAIEPKVIRGVVSQTNEAIPYVPARKKN